MLSCRSPSARSLGGSGYFVHSDWRTGLCDVFLFFVSFSFSVDLFPLAPLVKGLALVRFFAFPSIHSRLPPPTFQVIWRWISLSFSPSRTDRLRLFPFICAFLVGFVVLPFRSVGVGSEEPHRRLMLLFVESGFHQNSHLHRHGFIVHCLPGRRPNRGQLMFRL